MNPIPLKVVITGTTGMVGEGVLHECLLDPRVESVLVINRRSCGVTHPKLKEILHSDFFDLSPIAGQLAGYTACFFCLGVTSVGKSEGVYFKATYALTMHVAETLLTLNENMSICYVSGAHTDSTEKGRLMWARVKGKTENDLMKMPFRQVFAFRPGVIKPTKGMRFAHSFYKYTNWILFIWKLFNDKGFCTNAELGKAMIYAVQRDGNERTVVEVKDIVDWG